MMHTSKPSSLQRPLCTGLATLKPEAAASACRQARHEEVTSCKHATSSSSRSAANSASGSHRFMLNVSIRTSACALQHVRLRRSGTLARTLPAEAETRPSGRRGDRACCTCRSAVDTTSDAPAEPAGSCSSCAAPFPPRRWLMGATACPRRKPPGGEAERPPAGRAAASLAIQLKAQADR